MRRTQTAIDAFAQWKNQGYRHDEAFAMGYLMGQGDGIQGFDNILEMMHQEAEEEHDHNAVATIGVARQHITLVMQKIMAEAEESFAGSAEEGGH